MQDYKLNVAVPEQNTRQAQTYRVRNPRTGELGTLTQNGFVPDPKPESVLSTIAKGIIKTPLRAGATALAATEGALRTASGDLEGANRVMNEGYNVAGMQLKPYKIGTDIKEQREGKGMFGKNTLETFGAGAELASYGMGAGALGEGVAAGARGAKTAFQAAKTASKLEAVAGAVGGAGIGMQEEDVSAGGILGNAALGGAGGALLGFASPYVGKAYKGTKEAIGNRILRPKTPQMQKLVGVYDETLGNLNFITKKDKNLQARAKAMNLPEMSTGEFLLREQIELGVREEGGRNVYNTMHSAESLKERLGNVGAVKRNILESKKDKIFDLEDFRKSAHSVLDGMKLEVDKIKMKNSIDELIDTEINGKGQFLDGVQFDTFKSGLQSKGKFNKFGDASSNDVAEQYRKVASKARKELEDKYGDIAELKEVNYLESQYLNGIDSLEYLDGRPVMGGKLSKDLAGMTGAMVGMGVKLPVIGPIIGKESAEALQQYIANPQRITSKLLRQLREKGDMKYGEEMLAGYLSKVKNYNELQETAALSPFQRATKLRRMNSEADNAMKLLESPQMKAQRTLNQGGEIQVNPQGTAEVTPKIERSASDVTAIAERETPKLGAPKTEIIERADGSATVTMPDYKISTELNPQETNEMLRAGLLKREGEQLVGGENAFGFAAGIEPELDEDGKPTGKFKFDASKAVLGFIGMTATKKLAPKLGKEAVENVDNVLYHGSPTELKGNLRMSKEGDFLSDKPFFSFTDDPEIAKQYTKGKRTKGVGMVNEFNAKDLKVLDTSDFKINEDDFGGLDIDTSSSKLSQEDKDLAEAILYGEDKLEGGKYVDELLNKGYDGIKFSGKLMGAADPEAEKIFSKGNEIRIFNERALKKFKSPSE